MSETEFRVALLQQLTSLREELGAHVEKLTEAILRLPVDQSYIPPAPPQPPLPPPNLKQPYHTLTRGGK